MSIFNKINPFKGKKSPFNKFDPKKIVEEEINKLKGTLKREIIDSVKHELIRPVENELKTVKSTVVHQVKSEIDPAIEGIRMGLNKVEHGVEDVAKQVFTTIAADLAKLGLTKYVEVLKVFRPDSASLTLGYFSFNWEFGDNRLMYLEHLISHPPKGKSGVKEIFQAFGPDEVSVDLAFTIPVIELGLGGGMVVKTERLIEDLDKIL